MTYKTTSINVVLAKIFRDFNPSHSGWIPDAIEWISEAVGIMKTCESYKEIPKIVEIIDYRGKIPCDLEQMLGIEYNGMRLQRSGGINHKSAPCSCLDNLVCSVEESYSLNPNYIQTTFKTGCITVYYYGLEVDCDGFPYIVDDPLYTNAVTWYVIMKMCLRGFKHPVADFKMAEFEWEKAHPKAMNRCRFPDIDGYEIFKKSWLGAARSTNRTNEFFNSVVANSSTSSNTALPGDLVETFPSIVRP